MQSLIRTRDPSYITLGERRGKSDLARFSLDSSWPSAVSDTPHWAYPSPPMSGSPPIPPRRNPDFEDRGQGSFEARRQDASQGGRASLEGQGDARTQMQSFRNFQEPYRAVPYSYQQAGRQSSQPQFEQQQQQQQQQPQLQQPQLQQIAPLQPFTGMHMQQTQPNLQPTTTERPSIESGYQTPKTQRKTKGHVASACVPCKRAHLRCDAQRPCSRCLSNGKEEACIDVQHKKRGRPRLRDEREPRYESFGPAYRPPPPAEASMRRPLSMYSSSDVQTASAYSDPLHRSSSYRVLKSQGEQSSMARQMEYGSMRDMSLYATGGPPTPSSALPMTEFPLAYLTTDLSFVKFTQSFSDAVLPGVAIIGRKLLDVVAISDRDKVYRLQQTLEEERREREPNYLPPIFGRSDEEIQSVGLGMGEATQVRTNRQEVLTFQMPDGQQRPFDVRIGLAKKDSTYFVVLMLPSLPQAPPQSPFFREPQYAFRAPQQGFSQPVAPSPSFPYPPSMYHSTGPAGQVVPRQVPNMPVYPQAAERSDYSQVQRPMQIPRSELPQRPQHELQLPPIRTQGSAVQGNGQQRSESVGRGQDYRGGAPDRPNEGGRRY